MMQNDSPGNLGATRADCYHLSLLCSGSFLSLENKSSPLKQGICSTAEIREQYRVLYIRLCSQNITDESQDIL